MIVGSLSGPLCAAGGFCAGNEEVVEHQRISSASYTYSAALPALLSTTASETISLLQEQPDILTNLRERIEAMRAQLDPRSDWVKVTSSMDNPIMLLVLKDEVIAAKNFSIDDQNQILRDVVDEVSLNFATGDASLTWIVSRKRSPHYQTEGIPPWTWCQSQGCWLAACPCAEGVRYQRLNQEGDREGRCHHQARHHEDCLETKVELRKGLRYEYGLTKVNAWFVASSKRFLLYELQSYRRTLCNA
jgi:hypothetical protein